MKIRIKRSFFSCFLFLMSFCHFGLLAEELTISRQNAHITLDYGREWYFDEIHLPVNCKELWEEANPCRAACLNLGGKKFISAAGPGESVISFKNCNKIAALIEIKPLTTPDSKEVYAPVGLSVMAKSPSVKALEDAISDLPEIFLKEMTSDSRLFEYKVLLLAAIYAEADKRGLRYSLESRKQLFEKMIAGQRQSGAFSYPEYTSQNHKALTFALSFHVYETGLLKNEFLKACEYLEELERKSDTLSSEQVFFHSFIMSFVFYHRYLVFYPDFPEFPAKLQKYREKLKSFADVSSRNFLILANGAPLVFETRDFQSFKEASSRLIAGNSFSDEGEEILAYRLAVSYFGYPRGEALKKLMKREFFYDNLWGLFARVLFSELEYLNE